MLQLFQIQSCVVRYLEFPPSVKCVMQLSKIVMTANTHFKRFALLAGKHHE